MNTIDFIFEKNQLDDTGERPVRIPNVNRLFLTGWLQELGFKVGVEVGVAQGKYLRSLCFANPNMFFYGVDAEVMYPGYTDIVNQRDLDYLKKTLLSVMAPYPNHKMIRKFSMDAVKDFEDNSIDFVYIDANHNDPYVTQDIEEWTKKVRPGGIVSGHDYITKELDGLHWDYDVVAAVDKYVKNHNLTLFLLGLDEKYPGIVRESIRSWMFVKE